MNTITMRTDGDLAFSFQHTSAFDFRTTTPLTFVTGRASTSGYIRRMSLCVATTPDTDASHKSAWLGAVGNKIREIVHAHGKPKRGETIDENGNVV